MSRCQVHVEDRRRNHCHLTECKIVVYVLTLVDNIRLQVVGELIIKKFEASFSYCFFLSLQRHEKPYNIAHNLPTPTLRNLSGKDIALKTTCAFLKTLADNIELFLSLFLRVNFSLPKFSPLAIYSTRLLI